MRKATSLSTFAAVAVSVLWYVHAGALAADEWTVHSFEPRQLTDVYFSEGAGVGDLNRDGHNDVVYGPYWFAGPDFAEKHAIYDPVPQNREAYADNFFSWVRDFNDDGWNDVLVVGFPGTAAYVYENAHTSDGHWPKHQVFDWVSNESPELVNLVGDERPELVCTRDGCFGYVVVDWDRPFEPWTYHRVSNQITDKQFGHGLGVGDVNGDGRPDLLHPTAWFEQPADGPTDGLWQRHEVAFTDSYGGAEMHAYDVDGDGDNDVITSLAAHNFGLAWYEQIRDGDRITFKKHLIMGAEPQDNRYGVVFSEPHSVALADVDGDGLQDIVTGKTYYSHHRQSLQWDAGAVVYWFRLVRGADGVDWVPYKINGETGIGRQISVVDVNQDGLQDVVVGGMKGCHVLVHQARSVDEATWKAAQPQVLEPPNEDANELVVAAVDQPPTPSEPPFDEYPHAGLSAEEAAGAMEMPPGFHVSVFAAEPDVKQPIAMTIDDRGRVWIAEAYEYPQRAKEGAGRDRILIFDDTDGDGRFDDRKIFAEGLNLVSGLEVGFGGVWVGAAPYLLFIPDRDANDIPDGEPQVLLDGWGYQDTHETLNAFIWGPDGWLYGCHGVFTHSRVGKPGTADADRIPLNAAIWRYHPMRHEFEVFAHGTSNPWGVDFNDHGQAFCTACVIPHLFHVIQGARYQRQAGEHFNPYTYDDIDTIADHLHYLGDWAHWGNNRSDSVGGGHAHAGAMIYLGGAWPDKYHDQIFMNNIHGQRLNMDVLAANGSGYVGSHGPDFLLTGDRASQILNLRYGPDGQATMIDWYDMQACHDPNFEVHDRSNGRIYRIVYGEPRQVNVDLKQSTDLELAELSLNENDWYVRHARRILQERAATGSVDAEARRRLHQIATADADDTRRLRAMWALHVSGGIDDALRKQLLEDVSPYVRGWTIQLTLEAMPSRELPSWLLTKLAKMARDDDSPVVRLYIASALQQLPQEDRWEILTPLAAHGVDARDHNLPLMYWYAAEPLAEVNPRRALAWALSASESIPVLGEFMLRRIGSSDTVSSLALLVDGLGKTDDRELQLTFLKAMRAALRGQRRVEPPAAWQDVSAKLMEKPDGYVRLQTGALGATFGDAAAIDYLGEQINSSSAEVAVRREALEALLATGDRALANRLTGLVGDPDLREVAIGGLAQFDHHDTAQVLLRGYQDFTPTEKRLALATLCSRAGWALELLTAIEAGQIETSDLTADLARQLQYLQSDEVQRRLESVWGRVRETAADKAQLIAQYKQLLAAPASADRSYGRAVFAKTCQRCHTLYGVGDNVGPDLTGSNRADLDYLLTNIIDPSAVMAKEYQQTTIITTGGRVVTGIVRAEDDKSLTMRTADDTIIFPADEIDERIPSDLSLMPYDQLKQFSEHEVRALIAYLQSKEQVPLLATPENAGELFNGRDLSGWFGNRKYWSVDNGEIVGRTEELEHNEFLVSDMAAADFRLTLEVKLVDNAGNSGIQFRSRAHDGEMTGHQADIGVGWWGKLYEENGRALLWDKSGEEHVKPGEWNIYEVHATGSRIRTFINGHLCVDMDDPSGARRGVFALQLHAGERMEVRFRNIRLEIPGDTAIAHSASP